MGAMDYLKFILVVQAFFAFSITMLSYALPDTAVNHIAIFTDQSGNLDLASVNQDFKQSLSEQRNIPIIDMGALVFYSGNFILDLMLNFAFAVPQMIAMLINGFSLIFGGIDTTILAMIQTFLSLLIGTLYMVGLIQTVTNIRSQGGLQ
ncbi:MAG: hypothetical protein [Siphoviridae sp. ctjeG17]|nr:MAG: hypothetical protein [Siphoviridae sp. ctjeG17]